MPIVDRAAAAAGGVCALFQRMNEPGEMLRVASSASAADAERRAGTPRRRIAAALYGRRAVDWEAVNGDWGVTPASRCMTATGAYRAAGATFGGPGGKRRRRSHRAN